MLSKQSAINKLQRQLDLVETIPLHAGSSPQFREWHRDTEIAIQNIFGPDTRHMKDFNGLHYTLRCFSSSTPDYEFDNAFKRGVDNTKALIKSMLSEIKDYWEDPSNDIQPSDKIHRLIRLCDRFHRVVKCLHHRHAGRQCIEVIDEYDVQDIFFSLLQIDFDDVRKEEWTPSYAGGSSRMDFLLKDEGLVIEIKKTRKGLDAKGVADQLLIDISRYRIHPHCKMLFCFVYDPENRVLNPVGLEKDLTRTHENTDVHVIISPKGM